MALTLLEMTVGVSIVAVGTLAVTSTSLANDRIDAETRDLRAARAAVASTCDLVRAASQRAASDRMGWSRTLVGDLAELELPSTDLLEPWAGASGVIAVEVVVDERFDAARDFALDADLLVPRDLDGDGALDTRDVTDWANLLPVIVRARWETEGVQREHVQVLHASPY